MNDGLGASGSNSKSSLPDEEDIENKQKYLTKKRSHSIPNIIESRQIQATLPEINEFEERKHWGQLKNQINDWKNLWTNIFQKYIICYDNILDLIKKYLKLAVSYYCVFIVSSLKSFH